jgi:hypothetical protein
MKPKPYRPHNKTDYVVCLCCVFMPRNDPMRVGGIARRVDGPKSGHVSNRWVVGVDAARIWRLAACAVSPHGYLTHSRV